MPMKQINSTDRVLQTIQQNAAEAISNLETATQINLAPGAAGQIGITPPFTGGNLITGIALKINMQNPVNHGLGRIPKVWVLCDITTNSVVWRTSWDNTLLLLQPSVNCTVSVWVA